MQRRGAALLAGRFFVCLAVFVVLHIAYLTPWPGGWFQKVIRRLGRFGR